MTRDRETEIFAANLNYYMEKYGKTQTDLIADLGVNRSTISTWCRGEKMPRMGTVQTLADYFGIRKSDLIEDRQEMIDDDAEVWELRQQLREQPGMRILFDAARGVSKEDLEAAADMIRRFKKESEE